MVKGKFGTKKSDTKEKKEEVLLTEEETVVAAKTENVKITMQPSKRTKIKKTKIFLEGELDINNVDTVREELNEAISTYDHVDVCLQNVTQLDLSCIQLLYIFNKAFSNEAKEVTIKADLPVEIKGVVANCGFTDLLFKKVEILT